MQNSEIPSLANLQTLPVVAAATFAAFKVAEKDGEESVSFVRQYDPKVQAIEGFRHVVIRYRNTDKKVAEKPAQMVTIPVLSGIEQFAVFTDGEPGASLAKMLRNTLEDEQDAMIRSFIDAGQSNIYWSALTLEKIIEAYNAVRVSARLTKEQIEAWATIALKETCELRGKQIAESKGYNAEQTAKQIAGTINAYVSLAAKLAAPVPNIGQEQATALKNMLILAKLDDDMAKVLLNKLEAILNPKVVDGSDL